jgi:hypothetical protein
MDVFNPDTWKQQWTALMSAPYIIVPLLIIIAAVVWWFRGTMFQSTIAGLREQVAGLKAQFETQDMVSENRMHQAAEKVELERGRQESLARQINDLKGEIAKAGNDNLAARVAMLEAGFGELVVASNAVRFALTGVLNATEAADIANFHGIVE